MNATWLREAISDREGIADMAYIAIGAVIPAALSAVVFVGFMNFYDYQHCINTPITTISKGDTSVTSVVPCRFDPLPFGQAVGLIFAGFATLIGTLSAYMVATRRKDGPPPTVTVSSSKETMVRTTEQP